MKLAAALWLAAALYAQQPASLHGVVRDALTGSPIPNADVHAGSLHARTDAQGAYAISNLQAGVTTVDVAGEYLHSFGPKSIAFVSGRDTTLDFTVQALGRIGGFVFDSDGRPVADALVSTVAREYSLGALRYTTDFVSFAGSRGEFGGRGRPIPVPNGKPFNPALIGSFEAGAAYLLLASHGRALLAKPGEISDDPARRKPIQYLMWYIDARAPEAAMPLTLAPGELREGINIRMASGPGYCINGTLRPDALQGGELRVNLTEAPVATQGILGQSSFTSREEAMRICNLSPGDYRITSTLVAKPNTFPREFRTQVVSILDRDIKVALDGLPPTRLSGEIVWEGDPPADRITLQLRPRNHLNEVGETVTATASAPGKFVFDHLVADEYELQLYRIPSDAYLKDITAAGHSVLHRPLASGEIRIILGRDGSRISARTPADAWVVAVPAGVSTEADLAEAMLSGRADGTGLWTSPLLAPGKYLVLTSPAPVNRSFESVQRIFASRGKAREVNVAPKSTATVMLNDR